METIILIFIDFFFFASTSTSEGAAIAPRSRSKPSWLQEKTSEPLVALTEEMPKWGTKFPIRYRCENCMSWCSWNDGKLKTEFLQITSNVEHQQVLQAPWPVSICTGSGHPTGHFPVHSPGVAPLTSTQGCAEPTAPSCPGMLSALPALPSSPPPPAIQDQRCSVLPGGGEFEQVQKAHEHPARDLHKRLCQNTARRGRRERKIKGADTTPFKMTD